MPKLEQPVKQANASADGAESESSAPSYLRICSHYQEHIPQISERSSREEIGEKLFRESV